MDNKKIVNKNIEKGWNIVNSEIDMKTGLYIYFQKKDKVDKPMEITDEQVKELINLIENAGKWEKFKELNKELQ